jgi:hypothetical protein
MMDDSLANMAGKLALTGKLNAKAGTPRGVPDPRLSSPK